MLGLMKEDALVPVEQDPEVQKAMERLTAARTALDTLAVEEHRLIKLVTGREDTYSDEELEAARRRLSIHKGTQTGWHLPEAENVRQEVKLAERTLQDAVGPARARLTEAATSRIANLTREMDQLLEPVREVAQQIELVRQQMSDGGARPCEHACPALLPNQIVEFQMSLAKKRWKI